MRLQKRARARAILHLKRRLLGRREELLPRFNFKFGGDAGLVY
jgi:hypothetical protein